MTKLLPKVLWLLFLEHSVVIFSRSTEKCLLESESNSPEQKKEIMFSHRVALVINVAGKTVIVTSYMVTVITMTRSFSQ